MTTIDALLMAIDRHEREPFDCGLSVVLSLGWRREAAALFMDTYDDVPYVGDAIERTRQRLRIAASMAMDGTEVRR